MPSGATAQHDACHEMRPAPSARQAVVLGDDPAGVQALRVRLEREGFRVRHCGPAHQYFRDLHALSPCLVIACTPFHDMGHETVVRRIRDLYGLSAPVVVLGAGDDAGQHLAALEAGADDYVPRNLPADLMMARVRALMRRLPGARSQQRRVMIDAYVIDYAAQHVAVGGRPVALTPKEFDLFWVFASSFGRLISKRELLACVWGQNCELDTHTLSQHVHALRRKLRLCEHGLQLTALYGAGYRLERLGGAGDAAPLPGISSARAPAPATPATEEEPGHAWS